MYFPQVCIHGSFCTPYVANVLLISFPVPSNQHEIRRIQARLLRNLIFLMTNDAHNSGCSTVVIPEGKGNLRQTPGINRCTR
jgi:hypothetical protein